jgi:hypothetical protein
MSNIIQNGGIIYIRQDAGNIQYQSNSTSGAWTPVTSFPITFENSNPVAGNILTISLFSNITIGILAGYFITGSSYITYDGTGKTVTIDSISNYTGLIQNGSNSSNGYSNVTVQNINTKISGSSTLISAGGWICQSYFGRGVNNVLIYNCSNNCPINTTYSSGICGGFAGQFGNISIINCLNTGSISSDYNGGICGYHAGQNGNVSIKNCFNTGIISNRYSGGICASYAGHDNGKISINNCYNNGVINGNFSGGICGNFFGWNTNSQCYILNCYNNGNINGSNSGGITGGEVGYNNNNLYTPKILIQNCYSLGNIASTSGGICGGTEGSAYTNTPIVNITNCYTSYNSISQPGTGGNTGSQYISLNLPTTVRNAIILTNVYTSSISSWSDTDANNALTGPPQRFFLDSKEYIYYTNYGLTWYSSKTNTPYFLISYLNKFPRRIKRSFVNSLS